MADFLPIIGGLMVVAFIVMGRAAVIRHRASRENRPQEMDSG